MSVRLDTFITLDLEFFFFFMIEVLFVKWKNHSFKGQLSLKKKCLHEPLTSSIDSALQHKYYCSEVTEEMEYETHIYPLTSHRPA